MASLVKLLCRDCNTVPLLRHVSHAFLFLHVGMACLRLRLQVLFGGNLRNFVAAGRPAPYEPCTKNMASRFSPLFPPILTIFLTDSLCFVCYQGSLYVICYSHCRCFALWFFLVFRFDRDLRALHLRWRSVWRRLRVVAGVASVNVCLSDSEAASLRCPCTAISVISSSSGLANRQSYTPIFAIEAFLCNDSRLAKLQGMTQDAWRNCPC